MDREINRRIDTQIYRQVDRWMQGQRGRDKWIFEGTESQTSGLMKGNISRQTDNRYIDKRKKN